MKAWGCVAFSTEGPPPSSSTIRRCHSAIANPRIPLNHRFLGMRQAADCGRIRASRVPRERKVFRIKFISSGRARTRILILVEGPMVRRGCSTTGIGSTHTQLGRFCSRDPAGYQGEEELYHYAGNSPSARTDATGLGWWPKRYPCTYTIVGKPAWTPHEQAASRDGGLTYMLPCNKFTVNAPCRIVWQSTCRCCESCNVNGKIVQQVVFFEEVMAQVSYGRCAQSGWDGGATPLGRRRKHQMFAQKGRNANGNGSSVAQDLERSIGNS